MNTVVMTGLVVVQKTTDKMVVAEVGGKRIAAFGKVKGQLEALDGKYALVFAVASAFEGSKRLFTNVSVLKAVEAPQGFKASFFAAAGMLEAVRPVGKRFELVLKDQNSDSKMLVIHDTDMSDSIGAFVGVRGYVGGNNGFIDLVATEIAVGETVAEYEEVPF